MSSPQSRPHNQDPDAGTPPIEVDLVPTMDSATLSLDDSNIITASPHQVASGSPSQPSLSPPEAQDNRGSSSGSETPPNRQISTETPPLLPPVKAPIQSAKLNSTSTAGQKRPLPLARLRGSIHKPFRSPVRTAQPPEIKPAPLVMESGPGQAPDAGSPSTAAPAIATATVTTTAATTRRTAKPLTPHAPGVCKRAPFRPPTMRSQQAPHSSTTAGQLIHTQTLQAQITELRSSIRKGELLLKQMEKNERPIEELTAKWRKASQEGAQVLMEKYLEQESIFGRWDDNDDIDKNTAARGFGGFGNTPQHAAWGYGTDTDTDTAMTAERSEGSEGYSRQDRLQAMEEYIEHQDVQQDLPTVEEAIRSRNRPEVTALTGQSTKMTKMQRLLLGMGVSLDVIGYDPDQDAFVS
ncbi:hypothetical protein BGX29_003282 [Mortierella sp. GBA35]|nr:hypothetical protein BGX29_003282 [Mortierella sp. GBA35]